MKDTLYFLTLALIKKHNIKIDAEELAFQIKSHPSYPSIHAITGVLTHFNIDNTALQVPVNKETLNQLPQCFLAQIKTEDSEHIVLVEKKESDYKLSFDSKTIKIVTLQAFLNQFTGIIIPIEKDETKNAQELKPKTYTETFGLIAIALFIILFFILKPGLLASIHFLLSLSGIAISYLIVQHDLGIQSSIVDSICSQENKTTNCSAVLNSKGASISKNLKLGDVSFIYFTAISLSWFSIALNNITYSPLFIISLLAIPAIIYSIYYQVIIAKTWCLMCLGIVSVLTLQAGLFAFYPVVNGNFINFSVVLIAFAFIATSAIWLFSASKLKKELELNELKIESTKFKRNFHLFNTLLNESKAIQTDIPDTSEIVLGNQKSPLNIIIITNPFCGHCRPVHTTVENILKSHHKSVSITIRFNINISDLESKGVSISTRLLEIYHNEGELKCLNAMHDIYLNPDTKSWLNNWGKCNDLGRYAKILSNENEWCTSNDIHFTPEILINGKSFPKNYNRSDLAFFIEDLNEMCCTETNVVQLQETL